MHRRHFPESERVINLHTKQNDSYPRRAMLKTITFTLMHFCIAFGVAYALTGSVTVGGLVAVVEPLCNSLGFYFHEKFWQRFENNKSARPSHTAQGWLHGHA